MVKTTDNERKLPLVAQVFFGGCSLIGLYIVWRLLEKSHHHGK